MGAPLGGNRGVADDGKRFLALDVARTAVQNLDEHEDIALTTLSIDAFFEAIDSGEIDHGIVVSAAHYLARYLARTP